VTFRKKLIFYGEELLAPQPTPQAGEPSLFGRPRLLIQYIHSYHTHLEAASSIRNLRARHAVVTWNPPNMNSMTLKYIVAYLPHAEAVKTQKPRNTHATIEERVFTARCWVTHAKMGSYAMIGTHV
jgi:hypothetical protein